MRIPQPLSALVKRGLARLGYRLVPLSGEERKLFGHPAAARAALPPELARALRDDHPRLLELQRRYAALDLPMAQRTLWSAQYLRGLNLAAFRDDNVYLWQYRNVRDDVRRKYFLYLRYLADRDPRGLLRQLGEDGAFGCWAFRFEGYPPVSRDLLDSVNELYFLDRHWGLLERSNFSVLDIGAGYGRLAHRMSAATPGLERYVCVDGIAESTFLCEFYLGYRQCLEQAGVVPLDELQRLTGRRFDLAVNIHSFSEMSYAAIEGWLAELVRLAVPHLLVVPNEIGRFTSYEADGSRRDALPLLERHGFRLKAQEPLLDDANVRELIGVAQSFWFFERA